MKTTLAAAIAAAALALSASTASAAVTLDWTVENTFSTGCSAPPSLNCTWLGYVTNPTPFSGARGTATADRGATIAGPDGAAVIAVGGTSPRTPGTDFTFSYPAAGGSLAGGASAADWAGTMQFAGRVSFVSPTPVPSAGHGFTITVDDPRVVLRGDGTGFLYASGLKTQGAPGSAPVAYGDDLAVFALDLDGGTSDLDPTVAPYPPAEWRIHSDGSQTLSGIVPLIENAGQAFPASPYIADSGPNRVPNIFGSFAVTMAPEIGGGRSPSDLMGPAGPSGPAGARGPAGPTAPAGRNVTIVRRIQVVRLAKAPFGKPAKRVRVLRRGKLVARGRAKGRTVRVRLLEGSTRRLRGRYVLRVAGGKRRAVVRLG
ncbi:MAG TPA: HtaA domain-containing protein [Thermoleophilaceae bacterium]|nr:HtaA domain-containing protein [Thermoleophilaceae bacterium]